MGTRSFEEAIMVTLCCPYGACPRTAGGPGQSCLRRAQQARCDGLVHAALWSSIVALTSSGESSMIAMRLGMLTVRLCLLRSTNARIVDLSLIGVTFAQARWLGVMSRRMLQLSLVVQMRPPSSKEKLPP